VEKNEEKNANEVRNSRINNNHLYLRILDALLGSSTSEIKPVEVNIPLWMKLILKIPSLRIPSCLKNWEGLVASVGGMTFIILLWFIEFWLAGEVGIITEHILIRYLLLLILPVSFFVLWLRVQVERILNSLNIKIS